MSALDVMRTAGTEFTELTGLRADSAPRLERAGEGWSPEAEVTELPRVPDTMSLMATYEVTADPGGRVTGYRRVQRYEHGRADRRQEGSPHDHSSRTGTAEHRRLPLQQPLRRPGTDPRPRAGDRRVHPGSLVGIEILKIDVRVVVASVDTDLRFAEACNRLDLESGPAKDPGVPELVGDMTEQGAHGKTKGALSGAAESISEAFKRGSDEDKEPRKERRSTTRREKESE